MLERFQGPFTKSGFFEQKKTVAGGPYRRPVFSRLVKGFRDYWVK